MIMQLVRVAPIRPSVKFFQVRLRPQAAIASEPSAPKAAHSVAVAQPATSTQTMKTISKETGIRLPDFRSFSMKEQGGSAGGTWSGWRRLHQPM
jgi:hypothetical protein